MSRSAVACEPICGRLYRELGLLPGLGSCRSFAVTLGVYIAPMTTAAASFPLGLDSRKGIALTRAVGVVGFALLTALCAQVTIPIPGTPVPVTLQTLAVTLAALTLGGRYGAMSMGLYVLLGMAGVPVYAEASGGWQVVWGATGGYLLGFVLAQPFMAAAARAGTGQLAGWRGVLTALVVGHIVIFALGVTWLKLRMGTEWATALNQGLWPFLPGSLVKGGVAFFAGLLIAPWASRRIW